MSRQVVVFLFVSCLAVCHAPRLVSAAGGTSIVAQKGQKAYVVPSWPDGVADIVNDPVRTTGWNSWFSEWPNDVNQYAFEIKSVDDINRLIKKLSQTKSARREIRLSYLAEPNGLGWVTRVPKGNGIAVLFSVGDQARIDQWFKQVRKPFGKMEFLAAPVAVPPTLTIFFRNQAVDLEKLEIPRSMKVVAGYVPTVFHRSNTKVEKQREQQAKQKQPPKETEKLDAESQKAVDQIQAFLDRRIGGKNSRSNNVLR